MAERRKDITDIITQGAQIQGAKEDRLLRAVLGLRGIDLQEEDLGSIKDFRRFQEEVGRSAEDRAERVSQITEQVLQHNVDTLLRPLPGVTDKDIKALTNFDPKNREAWSEAFKKVMQVRGGPAAIGEVREFLGDFVRAQAAGRSGQPSVAGTDIQRLLQGVQSQKPEMFGQIGSLPAGTASTAIQAFAGGSRDEVRLMQILSNREIAIAEMKQSQSMFDETMDNVTIPQMVSDLRLNRIAASQAMQGMFQDYLTNQQWPEENATRLSAFLAFAFQSEIPQWEAMQRQGLPVPVTLNDWVLGKLNEYGIKSARPSSREIKKAFEEMQRDYVNRALDGEIPQLLQAVPETVEVITDNPEFFPQVTEDQLQIMRDIVHKRRMLGSPEGAVAPGEEPPPKDAFKAEAKRKKELGAQEEKPKKPSGETAPSRFGGGETKKLGERSFDLFVIGEGVPQFVADFRKANSGNAPGPQDLLEWLTSQNIDPASLSDDQKEKITDAFNMSIRRSAEHPVPKPKKKKSPSRF